MDGNDILHDRNRIQHKTSNVYMSTIDRLQGFQVSEAQPPEAASNVDMAWAQTRGPNGASNVESSSKPKENKKVPPTQILTSVFFFFFKHIFVCLAIGVQVAAIQNLINPTSTQLFHFVWVSLIHRLCIWWLKDLDPSAEEPVEVRKLRASGDSTPERRALWRSRRKFLMERRQR